MGRLLVCEHRRGAELVTAWCLIELENRPCSIYQYSNMAPRLSGQTSIFGVVFFVLKSHLGIERQKKLRKICNFDPKASEPC